MNEATSDSDGENVEGRIREVAGKMAGDEEMEAEGKRLRAEGEDAEQDDKTQGYSFPPG